MDLNNKKLYLVGSVVILAGLFFLLSTFSASAAGCEKSQNKFSFASFLNPLASLAEKVIKDFGYKISLAASPDPDFCGSDSVGCSGASATANISWTAGPPCVGGGPTGFFILESYEVTVGGTPYLIYNPGGRDITSFNVSSLSSNTTYNWSVEAIYCEGINGCSLNCGTRPDRHRSTAIGISNQPYGSFTTPNCVPPPPTVTLTTWSVFTIPDPVSLYWSSSNADSCTASGDWSGNKTTQGEEHFSKPRGNYTFTLICTGPGGSASDTENVRVNQVPQCSFTANPISIILPASSTLSWSCQYTDSCSIDQGIGSVNPVSGTKSVRPSQTTTYTLNCSGLDGSRSSQATVNIGFEPTRREVIPR